MGRNMHYDYSLELGSVNDEIISRISAAMKSSGFCVKGDGKC